MADEWSKECNISTLTESALQEIIQMGEKDPKLKVKSWSSPKVTGEGDHYGSVMYKLKVHHKREDDEGSTEFETHLIIKMLPVTEEQNNMVSTSCIFPTEISMYSDTLPQVFDILKKADDQYEQFVPKFYYGKDTPPYCLILEDLSPKGYVMAERRKGLDLNHSLLVLKTLGRFHAASASVNRDLIQKYSKNFFTEDSSKSLMDQLVSGNVKAIAAIVEDWPNNGALLAWKLKKHAEHVMKDVREAMKSEHRFFNVLNHGDLWVNNFLFRYDDTGRVEDLKIVDFQQCIYGSPAIDLQHFIDTSVNEEVREEHTEDLLKEYHQSLTDTLKSSVYGGKIPTYGELLEEYKRKNIYGFFATVFMMPAVLHDPDGAFDEKARERCKSVPADVLNRLTGLEVLRVLRRRLPVYEEKNVV